jgi:hypothetical protein
VRTYLSYFISIDTDPEEEGKVKTVREKETKDIMIFISMQQQKCNNLLLIIVFIILSTIALTGRSSAVEISCESVQTTVQSASCVHTCHTSYL